MLLKPLKQVYITVKWKKTKVKSWEIVEVNESTYNSMKTNYKHLFEFIPFYLVPKEAWVNLEWVNLKRNCLNKVKENTFLSMKRMYPDKFEFIDTKEQYLNYFDEDWKMSRKKVKKDLTSAPKKVKETKKSKKTNT